VGNLESSVYIISCKSFDSSMSKNKVHIIYGDVISEEDSISLIS